MDCFVRNKFSIFSVVMCSLLFVSCESNVEEKIQGIKLDTGAVIQNDSGELSNFNLLEGTYSKVDNNKVVGVYNSESGNYVFIKDGEYFYHYNGVEKKLDGLHESATNLKLSKNGSYLSYFTKENGILELKLKSLNDNSEIQFDSNVCISSTFMDWIDDENIVYYGISDEKVNGIFIYNVKEKKEKLFYKLDNGIIQYLKAMNEGVVCIQETVNNERILRMIYRDGSGSTIISEEVTHIKDIEKIGDDYFFIGKIAGETESIYKISNGKIKRLVFDFPAFIDIDKGLSKDEEGNILFIGKNDRGKDTEEIYKVTSKGTISKIKNEAKDYSFVDYQ